MLLPPKSAPFLLCLVFFLLLSVPQEASGQVDVHVANLTLTAIGWPQTPATLDSFTEVVTAAVCTPIGTLNNFTRCIGFLVPLKTGYLSLQMYTEATTVSVSNIASRTFRDWVSGSAAALLAEITSGASSISVASGGLALTQLMKISGVYTMPCRSNDVSLVLPSCETGACLTTLIIDGLQGSLTEAFCSLVPTPCNTYIVSSTPTQGSVMVNITGVINSLEIALAFTDSVRKSIVHATRVLLYSKGRTAQLYANNEDDVFLKPIKRIPRCEPYYGLWMLSLIAIVPILFIVFRYTWYKARHRAKKIERRIITEDEVRAQRLAQSQGYTGEQYDERGLATNENNYIQGYNEQQQQEQQYYEYDNQGLGVENYEYPQQYMQQQQQYEGQDDQGVAFASSDYPREYDEQQEQDGEEQEQEQEGEEQEQQYEGYESQTGYEADEYVEPEVEYENGDESYADMDVEQAVK